MERLTLACLQHLPSTVLFVLDLTAHCGTSVADQLAIRYNKDGDLPAACDAHASVNLPTLDPHLTVLCVTHFTLKYGNCSVSRCQLYYQVRHCHPY